MSRTTLCALTAAGLTVFSILVMVTRSWVLGDEVRRPLGPSTWKVIMTVQGTSLGNARLMTASPLDLDRQHVLEDAYSSGQLFHKPPEARHPERRQVIWSQRAGVSNGAFRARSEFHVALEVTTPNALMSHQATGLYAAPAPGQFLDVDQAAARTPAGEPRSQTDSELISSQARCLTADLEPNTNPLDVAEALFQYVAQNVKNEPHSDAPITSAAECLRLGKGDRLGKSRLLQALLRSRGIPARIVTGVTLGRGPEQRPHYWVEAWVYDHWLPMCPFYHCFGRVPTTYLIFGFGDKPVALGRHVKDLDTTFLIERVTPESASAEVSSWKRTFRSLSLFILPPTERRLVEILLLLPIAAVIICVFRNLIGLNSFGTFAPALIGLAFHDLHSLPGILVFVTILLIGWIMRRVLDFYHLLQVPRVAMMLTLIMTVLIAVIVTSNLYGAQTTRYISLFPLVILTGMVERFWTLETEDSTGASFRTLFQTMLISTVIALVLSSHRLVQHMYCYPETLGLIMAVQLLIGRYTGYRLMELFRFRDFLGYRPSAIGCRPSAIGYRLSPDNE
jgi:hypothetical protein